MRQCAWRSMTMGLAILAAAGGAIAQPEKSREPDRRSLLADMRGWTQAAEIDILPMIMEEPIGCAKQRVYMERWAAGLAPNGEPMGSSAAPRFGDRGPGPVDPTDVLNNTLEIEVAPPGGSLSGSNTMTIRSNVDNLTSFGFKLRWNFSVTACTVTDSQGSYLVSPTVPFSGSNPPSYARNFSLLRPINQNEVFTVRVDYSGTLVEGIGLGSVMFGGQNNNNANPGVVCTLSEPYYAATWWPCKDGDVFQPGDNADKATLNISITAPANFTSVANGMLQGIDDLPGNKRRYRWATGYPMSTYLVAFATTEYNHFTDVYDYGEGTMPLEFYIYPISDTPANRASWLLVKDMLEVFRPKFGLYPFINEKYGIYQFEFSGGMEHQTFSGQGRGGAFLDWLSAHELAHQWWGDEVTCRTWSDIWLNEGFATYGEALWAELKPGSPGQPALQAWMNGRRPANPNGSVYIPPADTANPGRIFNAGISYNKAGWVLHQLRRILGDETFFGFVQAYRAAFAGGAPTTAEFIALCNSYVGQDLSWYFNPWVYDVGAPTYEYGFQPVTIGGQQYLRLMIRQVQDQAYPRFTMPIDVDVTVASSTTTHVVRSFGQVSHFLIPIPDGSLDAVALDPRNWVLEYGKAQVAYTPGPPKVVMTSPAPGFETFASLAPSTLSIQFSDNISAIAADFAVTRDGDPVAFSYSYSAATSTATLDFGSPLTPGAYALIISDALTSAAPIPLALDGEVAISTSTGSLPSGDGAPGGFAAIAFSIVPDSGSCCSPAGVCSITEAAQCGHAFALGAVCDPNACPQPEACCAADGTCSIVLPAACAGSPQGPASTCEPNPCPEPTGACCCGSSCSVTTAEACVGPGTAFAGPSTACTPFSPTVPCCRGDFNRSGGAPTVQDIFDFLSAYFSSDACADSNDSAQITVQDIFDFLSAYFGGCP